MKKRLVDMGIFGALFFVVFTTISMSVYSGGTIHEPFLEAYSFLYNFFSDLGRTRTFDGSSNSPTFIIYIIGLTVAGLGVCCFNLATPFVFEKRNARSLAILASVFGVFAGVSYIGAAFHPWNVSYWDHTWYVRAGFISFMFMSAFYAGAVFRDSEFPDHYAWVLIMFAALLGLQILIMLFGPRSYHSNYALFIQATAQKIVVYGEILSMLYFCLGVRKRLR